MKRKKNQTKLIETPQQLIDLESPLTRYIYLLIKINNKVKLVKNGNEAYIGLIYLKSTDQKYEHKYRRLIDKDLFNKVQDKFNQNSK